MMRLAVHRDGRVVLTVPRGMPREAALRFAEGKAQWVADTRARFKQLPRSLLPPANRQDFKIYKEGALALARERVAHFNAAYGLTYRSVAIRNQKTRWGSCSKNGALSFTYRIALMPVALADYIIVHELCHLKEMNHSRRFWDLVSQSVPKYRNIRKQLRVI